VGFFSLLALKEPALSELKPALSAAEGPKERIARLRREKESLLLLFQALKGQNKVRHRRIKSVNGYKKCMSV